MSGKVRGSQMRKVQLKQLLDRGDEIRSTLNQQDVTETLQQVREVVNACNEIIEQGDVQDRRENTTEVVMDAQVLKMNHELVSKVFERSAEFNDQMYIAGLQKHVGEDWSILTNMVVEMACSCRVKSTMLGAIENTRKERAARQTINRTQTKEKEERPELVRNLERRDKGAEKINEVHKQVALLFQQYNVEAIPFYQLIIDPHNFMNTVENCFQLAFLLRDNIIGIRKGADNYPEVWLIKKGEPKPAEGTKQKPLSVNSQICQQMIEYYNITAPLLQLK